MKSQAVRFSFKPSLAVVILTGLLVSTMIVGLADRYAFTCGGSGRKCEGTRIEKPVLYGIPCGCWLIWILTSAPLVWIQSYASPTLTDYLESTRFESALFGGYTIAGLVANIIYYYLGSCIVVYLWR
ncbi:MAG: hypothetical protein ACREBU_21615, partial [Nitrososphaera sp.]